MPFYVEQLITNAYYMAGVVSIDLAGVSSSQMAIGLQQLNLLLSRKTIQPGLVPFYQIFNFPGIEGEQYYYIDNLIDVNSFCYYIGTNRFPTTRISRTEAHATFLPDNATALPGQWFLEPKKGGATITVRFKPSQDYLFEVDGKFRFSNVTQGQDLLIGLDPYYIDFLTLDLSRRLSIINTQDVSADLEQDRQGYMDDIASQTGTPDLSYRVKSPFLGNIQTSYPLMVPIWDGWNRGNI